MRRFLAEGFGTFALVLAGTGAVTIKDVSGGVITHVGIAATFGAVVMAMIYAFGDVSGARINPAVTIGYWAAHRFPGRLVLPYVASQLAGAFATSGLLRLLFAEHDTLGATQPAAAVARSFTLEVVLMLILMFVILSVSTGAMENGIMARAALGAVIAFEALFAGPICGASMDSARSLAPALAGGHVQHLRVYRPAPVIGATAAVLAGSCSHPDDCCAAVMEIINND